MSANAPEPRTSPSRAFDIRMVIALLFAIYGIVLTVMGAFGSAEHVEQSAGVNMNLWSGLGMLVFAILMGGWALIRPLKVPSDTEK
ncbi:hypothetical protein ACFPZ0_16310 [Streptomonospora nanhaiensis]|uniref:Uncharacterized protein n=1 Tax=Streptomonospora nanhaiensis TaxID=1323731 RepID=A0A853BVA6_9ACTN|nr:hypothetical protein [Streptomonospora nanhaiensis]MBV2363671.1 hypothetical protein [Streptomonospora nanhaiensis]MBX9387739.1 hypothetical protein [Streptomonospora nanhaiensis]NYI98716.1 hypothetical protein [Streptomonospora nanhaiensis]